MGLLQKAVETYDCHKDYIGRYQDGHAVLAPVSHIITRADIEITLNASGEFQSAKQVDEKEPKIIIPATESSAGRTSSPCAHPLCEQIGYLNPDNEVKYSMYVEQLTKWAESEYSHPKLKPVLTYVKKGTIISDLLKGNIVELNEQGYPVNDKLLVRWKVINIDEEDACWNDRPLFDAFINYYQNLHDGDERDICMVTGDISRRAVQHAKGIVPVNGNAKLISANDKTGFTYRGRFKDDEEAVSVSYEASQKAHNALRWLVSDQGTSAILGGRTFLCWNPQGRKVCNVTGPFAVFDRPFHEATDYYEELRRTLAGYKSELPAKEGVVIAAFDAATSGRLSLTYYNELQSSDFLDRLYNWDNTCCWYMPYTDIGSPRLKSIVDCAFGTQQGEKGKNFLKTDDRVMKQQIQRLISCRIDKAQMPADIVKALFNRASRPIAYNKNVREQILSTACAVIRKYYFDKNKEELKMSLEENKRDRSYQFGRLLAVLEKVERDTYSGDEVREPNAVKQQSVFCQRPLYVAGNLEKKLEQAYFPRLNAGQRIYYKNLIGQIMEQITLFPDEQWNRPLSETYLIGYYLQRKALYTKKTNDTEENENV